uniref:Tetratricopeptide repeat protein n=1 Tax=Parastrongyloides trichosuri TaxID=131310 RepID=A0A0N4Z5I8_PARTI
CLSVHGGSSTTGRYCVERCRPAPVPVPSPAGSFSLVWRASGWPEAIGHRLGPDRPAVLADTPPPNQSAGHGRQTSGPDAAGCLAGLWRDRHHVQTALQSRGCLLQQSGRVLLLGRSADAVLAFGQAYGLAPRQPAGRSGTGLAEFREYFLLHPRSPDFPGESHPGVLGHEHWRHCLGSHCWSGLLQGKAQRPQYGGGCPGNRRDRGPDSALQESHGPTAHYRPLQRPGSQRNSGANCRPARTGDSIQARLADRPRRSKYRRRPDGGQGVSGNPLCYHARGCHRQQSEQLRRSSGRVCLAGRCLCRPDDQDRRGGPPVRHTGATWLARPRFLRRWRQARQSGCEAADELLRQSG